VVDWFEELVSLGGLDWGMKVRLNTFELGLDLFGVQGNVRYSWVVLVRYPDGI